MKLKTSQKGFTIVELLIVIVVIAILAAISIVAYTGITNRANRSAAMEAANSVRSVITTYQGVNGTWPVTKQDFTSGGGDPIAKLPNSVTFSCTDPDGSGAPGLLRVRPHSTSGNIVGYTITYWDYAPSGGGAPDVAHVLVGDTSPAAGTAVHNGSHNGSGSPVCS